MTTATWRERARPLIARAIRDGRAAGLDGPDLKKFVHKHYPFGERDMWPYKVWLDEVKRQLPGPTMPADEDLSTYWFRMAYGTDGRA